MSTSLTVKGRHSPDRQAHDESNAVVVRSAAPGHHSQVLLAQALNNSGAGGRMISVREARNFLRDAVGQALARRGADEASVQAPPVEILGPVLQALPFASNRTTLANLVASAMDPRRVRQVLPAFVDVLRQLTTDEIALLRAMPDRGRAIPIADLSFTFKRGQNFEAYRNVLPPDFATLCMVKENIPLYVDNLVRLNIVVRPAGQIGPPAAYDSMRALKFLKRLAANAPRGATSVIDTAVLSLTDFGSGLRKQSLD